jgi:hypothetical protein
VTGDVCANNGDCQSGTCAKTLPASADKTCQPV